MRVTIESEDTVSGAYRIWSDSELEDGIYELVFVRPIDDDERAVKFVPHGTVKHPTYEDLKAWQAEMQAARLAKAT